MKTSVFPSIEGCVYVHKDFSSCDWWTLLARFLELCWALHSCCELVYCALTSNAAFCHRLRRNMANIKLEVCQRGLLTAMEYMHRTFAKQLDTVQWLHSRRGSAIPGPSILYSCQVNNSSVHLSAYLYDNGCMLNGNTVKPTPWLSMPGTVLISGVSYVQKMHGRHCSRPEPFYCGGFGSSHFWHVKLCPSCGGVLPLCTRYMSR